MFSPQQGHLPDKTQHSQQTDVHASDGIRTQNRAAADTRLWRCDHWKWRYDYTASVIDKLLAMERWWNYTNGGTEVHGEKTCYSVTLSATNPTWIGLGIRPRLRGDRPGTNRVAPRVKCKLILCKTQPTVKYAFQWTFAGLKQPVFNYACTIRIIRLIFQTKTLLSDELLIDRLNIYSKIQRTGHFNLSKSSINFHCM